MNVTLYIPDESIAQAELEAFRLLATRRGISLSKLFRRLIRLALASANSGMGDDDLGLAALTADVAALIADVLDIAGEAERNARDLDQRDGGAAQATAWWSLAKRLRRSVSRWPALGEVGDGVSHPE